MKWIKLAILSAIILFLVIFLMSLLLPAHVRISRAVNIHAPEERIAALAGNLETWPRWNVLVQNASPNPESVTANQIMSNGLEIRLTEAATDTIRTAWQNRQGRRITGVFTLQSAGEVTIVQWYFDFHQRWYPWEKFASINLDKQWGPAMERSLEELKKLCESGQELVY